MDLKTVDHLLTTTRSVRKRLDYSRPVEREVIEKCIELALQAPTGSNRQTWRFVVVTDPEKRAKITEYYKKNFDAYAKITNPDIYQKSDDDPQAVQQKRVRDSATYLSETMQQAPVFIICCLEGRSKDPSPAAQAGLYGSILPAAWSLMMALRSRGLGTAWTTLHLKYEKEVGALLGIPDDVIQTVLFPVAYFRGEDFKPAKRQPAKEKTYWDHWGNHN